MFQIFFATLTFANSCMLAIFATLITTLVLKITFIRHKFVPSWVKIPKKISQEILPQKFMFAKVYALKVVIVKVSTQSLHSVTSPDESIRC